MILELSDAKSLKRNHFKAQSWNVFRTGRTRNDSVILHFLDQEENELLLRFKHDGRTLDLLLTRNTELPYLNRKGLQEQGLDFMFDSKPEVSPMEWNYHKDFTKSGALFVNQLVAPISGLYSEVPHRTGTGTLLLTVGIFHSDDDKAKADSEGPYVVFIEIGSPENEDGGLVTIFQGVEIQPHEISVI